MRKSKLLTMMLVGLVLGACAVTGCKGEGGIRRYVPGFLKKKAAPAPPTEESFRRAADEYFVRSGCDALHNVLERQGKQVGAPVRKRHSTTR
jgi:hypothetical protein